MQRVPTLARNSLHGIMSIATATIYRNVFVLERRIELAGELIDSRLSRKGDASGPHARFDPVPE